MRFADLEPLFQPEGTPITTRDSLIFLCPKCFVKNGGPVGTHCIRVVNHQAKCGAEPSWIFRGTSVEDFTLDWAPGSGGRSSVQILGGCEAHFNIWNGEVVPANAPGGEGKKSW